jgi:hypothetical protein
MAEPTCVICGKPLADGAYACMRESDRAAEQLWQICDMVPAARDIAHGLSRRGGGGASGKPGSRLPLDLMATAKLDGVESELGTWLRHVAEERGSDATVLAPLPREEPIVLIAERLMQHLEWFRHRAEVDAFLADVQAAARVVAGLARGPAPQKYLGPCGAPTTYTVPGCDDTQYVERDCDGDVYVRGDASVGRCRTCGAEVARGEREAWLDGEVRQHAYSPAKIEDAYGISADTIRTWAQRPRRDTGEPPLRSYYRTDAGIVAAWADPPEGEKRRRLHYVEDVLDLAAQAAARRAENEAKRARKDVAA